MLLEEYLKPLGVGQVQAAVSCRVVERLNEIVLGKRGITADTALRFGRCLKTSPQMWIRLQAGRNFHERCSGRPNGRRDAARIALYLFCT